MPAPATQIFTGWMPFLPQSTASFNINQEKCASVKSVQTVESVKILKAMIF